MRITTLLLSGFALLLSACLEPLVDDSVPATEAVFPSAGSIPSVTEDKALLAQIDGADGVGRVIGRTSAFANGTRVFYWNFGPAPASTAPLFYLADSDAEGTLTKRDDHPGVIDVVPGQAGYSPFWRILLVPVTSAWSGERITSFTELQRAQDAGLVGPAEETDRVVNCPVVHPDVRLEQATGEPLAPSDVYYRGVRVPLFGVEALTVPGALPVADVYVLRREGGEPLDEGARRVDMTGDGDTNDTNGIFEVDPSQSSYTPLWRVVKVVVPEAYKSIDTFADETQAEYQARKHMFEAGPELQALSGKLIAFEPTDTLVNCPIEPAEATP